MAEWLNVRPNFQDSDTAGLLGRPSLCKKKKKKLGDDLNTAPYRGADASRGTFSGRRGHRGTIPTAP